MSEFRFACPACQRSFAWKPELAGRQAKCKCGHGLTVPSEPPAAAVEPAAPQNKCPSCSQALEPQAVLCVHCGYDLRTGRKVATGVAEAQAAPAAPASMRPASAVTAYPMSRRPSQEEPASSTKKYVVLGSVLLLVAMSVGGWIIFRSTGGGDANRPRLGDDAQVEEMIADQYPKDLTEWVQAHPSRMLGGKTANQAVAMEKNLKAMGATKVLAFGAGVLCRVIAIELPDKPAQRKALFDWHNENLLLGDPSAKDVGQRYILHNIGM